MSPTPTMPKKYFYICMKCSVLNPDLSVFESEEYKKLVAKDLNTGEPKFIFDKRDAAENKLLMLGTSWNLCVVNLPINKIGYERTSQTFHLKMGQSNPISVENIDEIVLHPLLRKSYSFSPKA